jgi:hypothetical protein
MKFGSGSEGIIEWVKEIFFCKEHKESPTKQSHLIKASLLATCIADDAMLLVEKKELGEFLKAFPVIKRR